MAEKYNIVYYMGAGASAMGIPVVADFKKVPEKMKEFLRLKIEETSSDSEKQELKKIQGVLAEFMSDFSRVSSMDTLAKRIYQLYGNGDKYRKYKLFLELIFCFQHFYKIENPDAKLSNDLGIRPNFGDPRYENLIRTIGETIDSQEKELKVEIPNNFGFITWNYDILFENTLVKDKRLMKSDNDYPYRYKVVSLFHNNFEDINLYNGAKMLKLNGTAFSDNINENIFEKDEPSNDYNSYFLDTIKYLIKYYARTNTINFAWENQNDDKLKEKLKILAGKTDIVVLIGYSFPTVNRLIDKAFFDNLKAKINSKTTLKVYIQGRDFSDSVRIERLLKQCYQSNKPHFETVPVESGDFFFVPSEYFEEKEIDKKINPSLFR